MKVAFLLVVLLLVACSSHDVRLGDGVAAGGAPSLAVPDFNEPAPLGGIAEADADDDDPWLTSDGSELYFNSNRAGNEDIWHASLAGDGVTWAALTALDELNTSDRETGITLAPDGLSLWFSSDRVESSGRLDIFFATRAAHGEPWSAPVRVDELCTTGDDLVSSISADGRELLMARREDGDDDYDLFVSRRGEGVELWSEAIGLSELNGPGAESDGFPVLGGAALAFTKDGQLVFTARADALSPFYEPVPLTALNSQDDDQDLWAPSELDYVVFSSNRSGNYLLYVAQRR